MKHGSAYPGDHHARSNPKIIHKTLFIQKLINPLPYCTKPPRHSFSKLYAPHSPSTPRPPLRSTTPERMVVVSTAAPSLRHRPHPTLVLHDTLRVPSGTTFRYKPFQGPGFLSGVISLLFCFRAFRESKTAARLLQQRQGHCGTSSMVMVWYTSCMASSASSRFLLPVSAPSFVSFRFGCSVCSSSSDTQDKHFDYTNFVSHLEVVPEGTRKAACRTKVGRGR